MNFFGGASWRVVGGGRTTIDGPGGVQASVSAVGGAEAVHFLAPAAGSRLFFWWAKIELAANGQTIGPPGRCL